LDLEKWNPIKNEDILRQENFLYDLKQEHVIDNKIEDKLNINLNHVDHYCKINDNNNLFFKDQEDIAFNEIKWNKYKNVFNSYEIVLDNDTKIEKLTNRFLLCITKLLFSSKFYLYFRYILFILILYIM